MVIKICVGSSCHLKGSADIIELLQKEIAERGLEKDIELTGSFCLGTCNRVGVTVQVDDEVHTGVIKETFTSFFEENILAKLKKGVKR